MAELNVEKRKKSPIGWIILGIVVIGLIVWFAASDNDVVQDTASNITRDNEQTSEYGQEQSQAVAPYDASRGRSETNVQVQEFLRFADESSADDLESSEVQEGINKLSDALMAIANEQTQGQDTWGGELEQVKQQASQLQDSNTSEQHATAVRSAFSSAANVIQNLQNRYYPELEGDASKVMDAAQEISDQELVSEQQSEIQSCFVEAADVLRKMDERSQTSSLN